MIKQSTSEDANLQYMIIGAGGCGGSIGAFLAYGGKDVYFIARGRHKEAMAHGGLSMKTTSRGNFTITPVMVFDEEEYLRKAERGILKKPDIIFVCVKFYSLEALVPFLQKISDEHTVIIPILNVYGTGRLLSERLPGPLVTDGCIYIAAEIESPGCVVQKGDIFRVVYGVRDKKDERPILGKVAGDLVECGIEGIWSDNISKDGLQKFSLISPMAACGAFYDVRIGAVQTPGKERETFSALVEEIAALGRAMDISLPEDIVQINLGLIDSLLPNACASMQRDLWNQKPSEIQGLVYAVPEMAKKAGITLPIYEKIAETLRCRFQKQ